MGGVGSERSGAGMNERSLVGRAQLQLTFTRKYVQLENFAREVWQEFALAKVFFSPRKKNLVCSILLHFVVSPNR